MLKDMGFLALKGHEAAKNEVERTAAGILTTANLTAVHVLKLFSEDESVGEER